MSRGPTILRNIKTTVKLNNVQNNLIYRTLLRLGYVNLCLVWGGRLAPPSLRKRPLDNRYRVEMHVHSPIFQGQLKEKNLFR